jgi:hypothetical protein
MLGEKEDRNIPLRRKNTIHKKGPDQIEVFRMHVDRRNIRIFDTRIFSHLLERLSKHGAFRGYGFCVDNQISDGMARQGLLATGSKESSGTYSV